MKTFALEIIVFVSTRENRSKLYGKVVTKITKIGESLKKKRYRSFFQRMFLIHDIKLASLKRLKEKLFVKEDLTNSEYEITRILYFIRLKKNQDLSSPRS